MTVLDLEGAQRRFRQALGLDKSCELCAGGSGDHDVREESSRTAYHWNGVGTDPNRKVFLCRPCAEEHHSYWDDMWAEWRAGQMG